MKYLVIKGTVCVFLVTESDEDPQCLIKNVGDAVL